MMATLPLSIELEQAIDTVEAELEMAERQCGTYADDPNNWHARWRVAMHASAERLTDTLGARIDNKWDGARVRICGITATATTGVAGALRNWLIAARKRDARP